MSTNAKTLDRPAEQEAQKPAVALYDLKNESPGVRVVYDSNNGAVAVQAGATRTGVSLFVNVADNLNKTAKKNGLSAAPAKQKK